MSSSTRGVQLADQLVAASASGQQGMKDFLAGLSDDDRRQLGVELAIMAANDRRNQMHAQSAASAPAAHTNAAAARGLTAAQAGITLDPSRAFDVGYIKSVMAQTARALGNPPPTDKDFNYWIPKILTIGGHGLDDYWLGRLLTPDTGGTGNTGSADQSSPAQSMDDDDIEQEIEQILANKNLTEQQQTDQINAVLKQHGRPTSSPIDDSGSGPINTQPGPGGRPN
jgi:hypothetical protein